MNSDSIKKMMRHLWRGTHEARKIPCPVDRFPDMDAVDLALMEAVAPYTMTSPERQYALIQSVRYVLHRRLEGAFVECGVWRGGSAMLIALVLQEQGVKDRDIYLYDTFEGMTEPGGADISHTGESAKAILHAREKNKEDVFWAYASLDDVKTNIERTGYPRALVHYIEGDVAKTIPGTVPEKIALLRLDTDWYQSTYHELRHLFPRLVRGGGLIIDDYGHWQGARQAVDQYFDETGETILLNRIDYTGRVGIKLD